MRSSSNYRQPSFWKIVKLLFANPLGGFKKNCQLVLAMAIPKLVNFFTCAPRIALWLLSVAAMLIWTTVRLGTPARTATAGRVRRTPRPTPTTWTWILLTSIRQATTIVTAVFPSAGGVAGCGADLSSPCYHGSRDKSHKKEVPGSANTRPRRPQYPHLSANLLENSEYCDPAGSWIEKNLWQYSSTDGLVLYVNYVQCNLQSYPPEP